MPIPLVLAISSGRGNSVAGSEEQGTYRMTKMSLAYLYPDPDLGLPQPYFELNRETVTIGRHPGNDLSLLLESVSRYHARIERTSGKWNISDLGSSNGTFVNGEKIDEAYPLHERDVITLGRAAFSFSLVGPGQSPAADEEHTSSVRIVTDDLGSATILSTQLSSESTPFKTAGATAGEYDLATLQKMTQRLMTLYRLSDMLRSATSRDEVLNSVIDLIFEVLPADRAVILTLDEPDEELEPQLVRYRNPSDQKELNLSRSIVQKCIRDRVAILSRDAKIDSRFSGSESIIASDIRSAICLPLVSKRNIIGVLFLDTNEMVTAFTEEDLNFASSLANELAMTLDNMNLTQENIHNERLAAVGQTIAGLAHNIKNILQLARGGIELMDGAIKRKAYADIETFWPVVRRGIDRMQSLTQEMLDFSRHTTPMLVEADVNVVLQELVETFRQDRRESGVEIQLHTDAALPRRRIDPDGLNKAVMNLLSNAMDALEGAPGTILISSAGLRDTIAIRVQDNGKGIPREKLNRIFQPFFTTKGSKGTGLGLSMTRKYVEDMGGSITVDSEEGRGTTFTIVLPPLSSEIGYDFEDRQRQPTTFI